MFEPKVFSELKNAQAIVLAYDGLNPQPPTLLLFEAVLPRPEHRSYFEQLAKGEL